MTERTHGDAARNAVLEAIRQHLSASARLEAEAHGHPGELTIGAALEPDAVAARGIEPGLVEAFRVAVVAVAGRAVVVRDVAAAAATLQQILQARQARRVAVSDSRLVQG